MMTLAQAAVITDKRIIKPSASILSNKSEERFSTAPDDEFQSIFHKVGFYKFNDDVPSTEIDIVPAIINKINKHTINIAATSNDTPKNELSALPSTYFLFEHVYDSSPSDRKIDPASKTRKMMDNSYIGNDQDLTVDAVRYYQKKVLSEENEIYHATIGIRGIVKTWKQLLYVHGGISGIQMAHKMWNV